MQVVGGQIQVDAKKMKFGKTSARLVYCVLKRAQYLLGFMVNTCSAPKWDLRTTTG